MAHFHAVWHCRIREGRDAPVPLTKADRLAVVSATPAMPAGARPLAAGIYRYSDESVLVAWDVACGVALTALGSSGATGSSGGTVHNASVPGNQWGSGASRTTGLQSRAADVTAIV